MLSETSVAFPPALNHNCWSFGLPLLWTRHYTEPSTKRQLPGVTWLRFLSRLHNPLAVWHSPKIGLPWPFSPRKQVSHVPVGPGGMESKPRRGWDWRRGGGASRIGPRAPRVRAAPTAPRPARPRAAAAAPLTGFHPASSASARPSSRLPVRRSASRGLGHAVSAMRPSGSRSRGPPGRGLRGRGGDE